MKSPAELHHDQVAYWNGTGGNRWIDESGRTESMLAHVAALLFQHAKPRPGETVLDVGCGLGPTTIELARLVGPSGRVVGLDVSAPMIERARHRAAGIANIEFVEADAVTHPFAAPFADLIVSRFGVMFFGDPVAAFANLRQALKPRGRLVFACWQKFDRNPWMQVPLAAAYRHVPRLPPVGPDEPGPFSFGDPDRLARVLIGAGFAAPRLTAADLAFDVAGGGGLAAAVQQAMTIGVTARALQDQSDTARASVADSIRAALTPYLKDDKVELPGAIWIVESAAA